MISFIQIKPIRHDWPLREDQLNQTLIIKYHQTHILLSANHNQPTFWGNVLLLPCCYKWILKWENIYLWAVWQHTSCILLLSHHPQLEPHATFWSLFHKEMVRMGGPCSTRYLPPHGRGYGSFQCSASLAPYPWICCLSCLLEFHDRGFLEPGGTPRVEKNLIVEQPTKSRQPTSMGKTWQVQP